MGRATISKALTSIINTSRKTATFPTFPDRWKHAVVTALLKKPSADPKVLSNYQPIALIPFSAKIIEKTINRPLSDPLEHHKLLDDSQSGFRSNHSTETALIAATDDIFNKLNTDDIHAVLYREQTANLILRAI